MTASFSAGSLLLSPLEGDRRDPVRVVWKKGDKDRARSLPVGRYRATNVSIEREHRGEIWTLSASGLRGPILEVRDGQETRFTFEEKIVGRAKMRAHGDRTLLLIGISAANRMGVTLLKGKDKVQIRYTAFDRRDGKVASGILPYV